MTFMARLTSHGSGWSARNAPAAWPRSISTRTRSSTWSCAWRMRSAGSSRWAASRTWRSWSTTSQLAATRRAFTAGAAGALAAALIAVFLVPPVLRGADDGRPAH